MADDDTEDPVVHEVDVYLSKSLASNLYVLQYPLRPEYMSYQNVEHMRARVKPQQKVVELELGLNTKSLNYSKSKGEQIALNVEGRSKQSGEEPYYASGVMDKQVLRSFLNPANINKYAVGVLKNDELHLTPVHAVVQMRPTFDYLDKADRREKTETAAREAAAAGDSSQDEEEEVQAVTVKFARPESEEAKARRLASYEYIQHRLEEDPWCPLTYHNLDEDVSVEPEFELLYGVHGGDKQQQFHKSAKEYLDALLPRPDNDDQMKMPKPTNILNRQQLKQMSLPDAVRALLTNVKVVQFSKLMELLPEGTDPQAALRLLQQVAVMVQGCWVVKSEVLYPKDTCSPHSGVSAEHLIRGRDFVMWKFTHCKFVVRKEVACGVQEVNLEERLVLVHFLAQQEPGLFGWDVSRYDTLWEDLEFFTQNSSSVLVEINGMRSTQRCQLPSDDVKDILEQMSTHSSKGWKFVFDYDRDFVDRHGEVVHRQRLLWDAKLQSLSKHFKMPKDADKKAREAELALMKQSDDRPRRRRASSRSSPRKRTLSLTRSISDLSDMDMETDAAGDRNNPYTLANSMEKLTTEPMEVCGEEGRNLHQSNHSAMNNGMLSNLHAHDATDSSEVSRDMRLLKKELRAFAHEVMVKRPVIQFNELKREFYLKLSQVPSGHVLSSGVSDRMLEEAVVAAGGFQLNKPLTGQSTAEAVFAYLHQGNRMDRAREVLFSMLEYTCKLKSTPFITKVREAHGEEYSDAELKKMLREFCESRNNLWYLRGTAPNS